MKTDEKYGKKIFNNNSHYSFNIKLERINDFLNIDLLNYKELDDFFKYLGENI